MTDNGHSDPLRTVLEVIDEGFCVCEHLADIAWQESERRFRSLTDNLSLVVWVHDAHGAPDFVNQTFCDFFGTSRDEMQADRWTLLSHLQDAHRRERDAVAFMVP